MSEARAKGTASCTARPIAREDRTDADQTRRKPRMTMSLAPPLAAASKESAGYASNRSSELPKGPIQMRVRA
jgi:hypothetical protein